MLAAARFLLLLATAAGTALIPTTVLFYGIARASQLRTDGDGAALFIALFVPCFFLLVCVFLRQQSRLEN